MRALPLRESLSFYLAALILGPLLGSFITEPAAMTLLAWAVHQRRRYLATMLGWAGAHDADEDRDRPHAKTRRRERECDKGVWFSSSRLFPGENRVNSIVRDSNRNPRREEGGEREESGRSGNIRREGGRQEAR